MAGWNLKYGELKDTDINDDMYWSLFNFVFSDSSMKRNTYKFGLIKSILDNLFNGTNTAKGFFISYSDIFGKFTENYWNLVVKYDLRQMRRDSRSELSRIETILKKAVSENQILKHLEYEVIEEKHKAKIIKRVTAECKKCVIGALCEDFGGSLYGFSLIEDGLYLSYKAYDFLLKYKMEIEKLNYYSWAKFMERINSDDALVRIIDKLELSTPRRSNLSIYREILRQEFEVCNCFYCGRKLTSGAHVDHLIPWSFVKDDKIWNFVLSCSSCNIKKKDRVPSRALIHIAEERNKTIMVSNNIIIRTDFEVYTDGLLDKMWKYAKMSGFKEFMRS